MSGEPTALWWFAQMDKYFLYGKRGLSHLPPDQQREVIQRFRENQENQHRERLQRRHLLDESTRGGPS